MKILQINKFYYKRGGSESHFIALVNLLRKSNHQVSVFSTENRKNISSTKDDYFIQEIDMSLRNAKKGLNLFYNFKAMRELKKIILSNRPDVVHVHNISHHFSPAILKLFKKFDLPVIMTVHDYKLICPNYKLFNKGKVCEKCIRGRYSQCFLNKCVKNSYLGSLVLSLEAYWAKWKKYYDSVDIFIAPSQFMQSKLIEAGIADKKIKYLPNFLEEVEDNNIFLENEREENYILFLGRLSEEKGLNILIDSFRKIKNKRVKLKIAGEGFLQERLRKIITKLDLSDRIEFLGYKSGEELKKIILRSKFIVVPSLWYENAPYTILEAYAFKKAVLGARTGGIPEIIEEEETGLTFQADDSQDLAKKIDYLLENNEKLKVMGRNGNLFLKYCFNEKNYLDRLLEIYKEEVSKKIDK